MTCIQQQSSPSRQRGAVLFVALVFLVLLTLLGLTAAGTSVLQERMTGGMRNAQMAMMGSESALRHGEVDLWAAAQKSNAALFLPPCAQTGAQPCVYTRTAGITDKRVNQFRSSRSWLGTTDGASAAAGTYTGLGGNEATANLSADPRYLIEDMGSAVDANRQGNASGSLLQSHGPGGGPDIHLYRVTSRSQGGNNASMRVTESVFGAYNVSAGFNPDPTP